MAGLLPLATLIVKETKEAIYAKGLEVATSLSLPVTSWLAGDPTRSLYHFLAEILAELEDVAAEYIKAGFLDFAEGDELAWLILLAKQVFNVDTVPATFATTSVLLMNGGGGLYVIAAGDLTVKNGTTGKTYRNTTGGTLQPATAFFNPADVNTGTDTITSTNSLSNGDVVVFTTTGALPGGLSAPPSSYYVINRTGTTFQVSLTAGGSAVDLTSQGSGVHRYQRALSATVTADQAGSSSSASAGEIDTMVTTLLGVTVTNPTAAVGVDAESRTSIIDRCRAKLATLSANGPKDVYSYVVRTPALAGTSAINRARATADGLGNVTVYVAGPSGTVAGGDVTLAQAGVDKWAEPLGVTATVVSATAVTIAVTYELWVYASVGKTADEIKADISDALAAMFLARPIGGDVIAPATGRIYHSMIESTIRSTFAAYAFRVNLTVPAIDTDLTISQVAVLGTVSGTINIIPDP